MQKSNENDDCEWREWRRSGGRRGGKAQKKSYYGISCDRIRKAQIAVFYVWHFMKSGKTLLLLIHYKQKANKNVKSREAKKKNEAHTQTHNSNHKIKEFIWLFSASHSLCISSFLIQFFYHANHSRLMSQSVVYANVNLSGSFSLFDYYYFLFLWFHTFLLVVACQLACLTSISKKSRQINQ